MNRLVTMVAKLIIHTKYQACMPNDFRQKYIVVFITLAYEKHVITRVGFFNLGSSLKHFVMQIPLSLPRGLLFSSTDDFKKTLSHCLQNRSQIVVIVR